MQRIILAEKLYREGDTPEKSGVRVANVAVEVIQSGQAARVRLKGVPSAAEAYFEAILKQVAEWCGPAAIDERLSFEFEAPPQKFAHQRAREAVLKRLTGGAGGPASPVRKRMGGPD